jgi:hypothetical protein
VTGRGSEDAELELEFEIATRRLSMEIPAALHDGVLHGYRGLRDLTALLHRAEAEQGGGDSGA